MSPPSGVGFASAGLGATLATTFGSSPTRAKWRPAVVFPDVKVYPTLVEIKDSVSELKPGMSAEVTIFTDSARDHCLTVPVQAILAGRARPDALMKAAGF